MKKLNGYAATITSFMAGISLMSGHEHNVLICIISLVFTVFILNDWGFGGAESDEQVDRTSNSVGKRSEKKGA